MIDNVHKLLRYAESAESFRLQQSLLSHSDHAEFQSQLQEIQNIRVQIERYMFIAQERTRRSLGVSFDIPSTSEATQESTELLEIVLEWLGPDKSTITRLNILEKCVPDTGSWLFNHVNFREWLSSPGRTLWLHVLREIALP